MTQVKFCGITRPEDAELAADLGAWAVGLILWPGSPRACDLGVAAGISRSLRRRVEIAGVFVNATLEHVAATADGVGLSLIQLHGDEGPDYCREVQRRTGCRVIKATRVGGRAELQALRAWHPDLHLLDTRVEGERGGTGRTWDWTLATEATNGEIPVLLSGGLTPENVGQAIAAARPWGVDVASGVETEPGIKDPTRMEAFAVAAAGAPAPVAPA